jgi:hypothetical protein
MFKKYHVTVYTESWVTYEVLGSGEEDAMERACDGEGDTAKHIEDGCNGITDCIADEVVEYEVAFTLDNSPGVLYLGSREDYQFYQDEGDAPRFWYSDTVPRWPENTPDEELRGKEYTVKFLTEKEA